MPTVSEVLTDAIQHHQAGRLQVAEQLYRQILAADPTCVDAWNLLGVVATQTGQFQHAVQWVRQALQLHPRSAELHYNLGCALHGQGKLADAVATYRKAIELDPNDRRPLNNLGNVLHDQGNLTDAIVCHRRACELNPSDAESHFNLANDFKSQNNWDPAVASYEHALRIKPNWAEALSNLGDTLQGRGELDAAIAAYRRALVLWPNSAQILSNLGGALQNRGDLEEAIAHLRRAVELRPDLIAAQLNLGIAFHKQCKLDEAQPPLRKALELNPSSAEAHNIMGLVLRDQGKPEEALSFFQRAVSLRPDLADARTNCAIVLLAAGDFSAGWAEYEWRWKTSECPPRPFDKPRWNGERIEGQTILLYAEQGLGDTLQFIRYASLVKELGVTVVVECQKALVRLLSRCPGIDRLIGCGEELPRFDVQAPLQSLPALLKTNVEGIPTRIPYLFADPQLVHYWCDRLAGCPRFRIGIHWHGRAGQGIFRQRDIPLQCFSSLNDLPITLINLQQAVNGPALSAASETRPIFLPGDDVDHTHGAFMDTAAIMMNLDLIITSDTSLPHLAGALGIPVWIALPFVASWQWMRDRSNSPWYPTARLFRQKIPGDWNNVFAEIYAELQNVIDRSALVCPGAP